MQPNVTVPDTLLRQLAETAEAAGITVNEFATLAVAEKIARFEHTAWLAKRKQASTAKPDGVARLVDGSGGSDE